MATFTLAMKALREKVQAAKQLAEIARETGGSLSEERDARKYFSSAGDEETLRGIPVQARGIGGTARGTDPLRETLARERRIRRSSDDG